MSKYRRTDRSAYIILKILYYYGRILGVFSWGLQEKKTKLRQANKLYRILVSIWRFVLTIFFTTVVPKILEPFVHLSDNSYLAYFANIQAISLTLFSSISYVILDRSEDTIFQTFNRFVNIYKHIAAITDAKQMLGSRFVRFAIFKFLLTLVGLTYEIPLLTYNGHPITATIGIYLWLGSTYILDFCYLGFLIITQMYKVMYTHLAIMIVKMKPLEKEFYQGRLSQHKCMKELCLYSESIDVSNDIYHMLYELTKDFQHIFRWQIAYYIYYNFVLILMLLHQLVWEYMYTNYFNILIFYSVILKFFNVTLLILCTNDVVKTSHMPDLLTLDLICSDMDDRWDESVEWFICQRNVENLEIKILGLFHLNNEFILVILSAIMSYLFLLIQFSLTRKFVHCEEIAGKLKHV